MVSAALLVVVGMIGLGVMAVGKDKQNEAAAMAPEKDSAKKDSYCTITITLRVPISRKLLRTATISEKTKTKTTSKIAMSAFGKKDWQSRACRIVHPSKIEVTNITQILLFLIFCPCQNQKKNSQRRC
jgi:hypothetical protein